ncbi:MAG: hypothetical protein ABEJ99_01195 [Candidatus Nanohaloarchaea archaeon]
MSVSAPPNPEYSRNPNMDRLNFWTELGFEGIKRFDNFERLTETLYTTPVDDFSRNSFKVNNYGQLRTEPEGEMDLRAARKLLGGGINEGDEILVRMLQEGGWPDETYNVSVEVVDMENLRMDEDVKEKYGRGYIMIEEGPDGLEPGLYDFTVVSTGSDYAISGDVGVDPADFA